MAPCRGKPLTGGRSRSPVSLAVTKPPAGTTYSQWTPMSYWELHTGQHYIEPRLHVSYLKGGSTTQLNCMLSHTGPYLSGYHTFISGMCESSLPRLQAGRRQGLFCWTVEPSFKRTFSGLISGYLDIPTTCISIMNHPLSFQNCFNVVLSLLCFVFTYHRIRTFRILCYVDVDL